jgi:hypothetical protein
MSLPGGGPALLESATVQGPADEWRTLPLLIELSFGAPDGLRFTRHVQSYAATLQRFHRQAAAISSDGLLSLSMPAAEKRRGDFEALLETIGLSIDRGRGQVKLRTRADDVARVATLKKAGVQLEGIVERLNAGESVVIGTKDTVVPLPLGQAFWSSRLDALPSPRDLVWAILASRELSSLYYGLLSLDEATLTAVQSDPKLANSLIRRASVLPIAAPALRIADGRPTCQQAGRLRRRTAYSR